MLVNVLQVIASGVATGAIYAFLALALVMIYRSTGIINFAQGEMAMFSTFIAWTLVQMNVPVVLAVLIAMAVSFVFGGLLEWAVVRRVVGRSDEHGPVILTIGLFLIINNLAGAIWLYDPHVIHVMPDGVLALGGVRIAYQSVGSFLVLLVALLLLYLLFRHTRLGLSVRAAVSNRESASLSGVRPGRMLMFGWCLAAMLGALAGALVAPSLFLSPHMMAPVLAYALAGAALGGFDSLPGAVIGGMIIGLSEALAGAYIGILGSDLKILIPVGVLFITLLFKPEGLLGKKSVSRV
jgi:branched-chain amino acid transport system permease protein